MVKRVHVFFVIGLVLGAAGLAVGLDLAGSDGVQVSDGVPLSSPNNNTVVLYGDTNVSLENFAPTSDSVELVTEDGNMTVTSAGDTRVGVLNTAITGSETRLTDIIAGGTWIEANPEDKNPIEFRGDLNELHWATTFDLDSTVEDVYISGPDGTVGSVRYSDFPANKMIKAVDVDTGTVLDQRMSDSNGQATFDIPLSAHSVSFETFDNQPPTASNLQPDGTIRYDNTTLSADISDPNFGDGDEVQVDLYLNGTVVSTQNITTNQTVTAGVSGLSEGGHNFTVKATDYYGLTDTTTTSFTVEHYEPEATNLEPQGGQSTTPSQVSADIRDGDFPRDGDSLTVEIYIDNSLESTQTITSNQTVSTAIPSSAKTVGQHSYTYNVTDSYGNSINATETWQNPGYLRVYNETVPHNLLDNTTVNATVTGEFGSVDLGTTEDGTFNFSGLPAAEDYVFTIESNNYYSRAIYVPDIFANRSIYLLSLNEPAVRNRITITDRTGRFQEDAVLLVDRVINTSTVEGTPDNGPEWVTVAGERIGISDFYDIDLQEGARYRFRVRNSAGDTRVLSEYVAKTDGTVDLKIGSLSYSFGDPQGYQWDVSTQEVQGGNYSVTFAYNDNSNLTSQVNVELQTRENGTVIDSATFSNGPYGEVVFTTQINNSTWQNNEFKIVWEAERDGESISGSRILGGDNPLPLPLDGLWKAVAYALTVFVLAFLVGAGAGAAPAVLTVGLWSGFAVYIELAPPVLGAGATILVIAMGAIIKAKESRTATVR